MNIKKLSVVILISLAVLITGCRTQPVRDVVDAPVTAEGKYTLKDMEKVIKKAGQNLGWGMRVIKPGHIVATVYERRHMAKVDIKYTKKSYSIIYKDSAALKYDVVNIHKKYNAWVSNLDLRISSSLSNL